MRLLRKSLGYATISAGLAGVTVALVYGPEELRRKITSNGLVRVGRSARTVSLQLMITGQILRIPFQAF